MSINLFKQDDQGQFLLNDSPEHFLKVQQLKERLLALNKNVLNCHDVAGRVFELLDHGDFDTPWRYHSIMKGLIALALKHPEFMEAQGGYKQEAAGDLFRMLYFFERLSECDYYHGEIYMYVLDQYATSAEVEMIERDIDQMERKEIARTMDIKGLLSKAQAAPSSMQAQLDELRKEMKSLKAENNLLKKSSGKVLTREDLAMAS